MPRHTTSSLQRNRPPTAPHCLLLVATNLAFTCTLLWLLVAACLGADAQPSASNNVGPDECTDTALEGCTSSDGAAASRDGVGSGSSSDNAGHMVGDGADMPPPPAEADETGGLLQLSDAVRAAWRSIQLLETQYTSKHPVHLYFGNLPPLPPDTVAKVRIAPETSRTARIYRYRRVVQKRPFAQVWESALVQGMPPVAPFNGFAATDHQTYEDPQSLPAPVGHTLDRWEAQGAGPVAYTVTLRLEAREPPLSFSSSLAGAAAAATDAKSGGGGPRQSAVVASFTVHVLGVVNYDAYRSTAELYGVKAACFASAQTTNALVSGKLINPTGIDLTTAVMLKKLCSFEPHTSLISDKLRIPVPSSPRDAGGAKNTTLNVWLIHYNEEFVRAPFHVNLLYFMGNEEGFATAPPFTAAIDKANLMIVYTIEDYGFPVSPVYTVPFVMAAAAFVGSYTFVQTLVLKKPNFYMEPDAAKLRVLVTMNFVDFSGHGLSVPHDMDEWAAIRNDTTHPLHASLFNGSATDAELVPVGETVRKMINFDTPGHLLVMATLVRPLPGGRQHSTLLLRQVWPVHPQLISHVFEEHHAFGLSRLSAHGFAGAYLLPRPACTPKPPADAILLQERRRLETAGGGRAAAAAPPRLTVLPNGTDPAYYATYNDTTVLRHDIYLKATIPPHHVAANTTFVLCMLPTKVWFFGRSMPGRTSTGSNFSSAGPSPWDMWRLPTFESTLNRTDNRGPTRTGTVAAIQLSQTFTFSPFYASDVRRSLLDESASEVTFLFYGSLEQTHPAVWLSLEVMPAEPPHVTVQKFKSSSFKYCSTSLPMARRVASLSASATRELAKKLQRNAVGLPPLSFAPASVHPAWLVHTVDPGEHALCIASGGFADFIQVVPVPGPRYASKVVHAATGDSAADVALPLPSVVHTPMCTRVPLSYSVTEGSRSELLLGAVLFLPFEAKASTSASSGDGVSCDPALWPLTDVRRPLFYEEIHHQLPGMVDRVVTAGVTFFYPGNYTVCFNRAGDQKLQSPDKLKEAFLETLIKRPSRGSGKMDPMASSAGSSVSSSSLKDAARARLFHGSPSYLVLGVNKTNFHAAPSAVDMRTPVVVTVGWHVRPEFVGFELGSGGGGAQILFTATDFGCVPKNLPKPIWGFACARSARHWQSSTRDAEDARYFTAVDEGAVVPSSMKAKPQNASFSSSSSSSSPSSSAAPRVRRGVASYTLAITKSQLETCITLQKDAASSGTESSTQERGGTTKVTPQDLLRIFVQDPNGRLHLVVNVPLSAVDELLQPPAQRPAASSSSSVAPSSKPPVTKEGPSTTMAEEPPATQMAPSAEAQEKLTPLELAVFGDLGSYGIGDATQQPSPVGVGTPAAPSPVEEEPDDSDLMLGFDF